MENRKMYIIIASVLIFIIILSSIGLTIVHKNGKNNKKSSSENSKEDSQKLAKNNEPKKEKKHPEINPNPQEKNVSITPQSVNSGSIPSVNMQKNNGLGALGEDQKAFFNYFMHLISKAKTKEEKDALLKKLNNFMTQSPQQTPQKTPEPVNTPLKNEDISLWEKIKNNAQAVMDYIYESWFTYRVKPTQNNNNSV